jgi:tRNA(Leu) C34 or U34 (ribose-2'-O)-methylase TrmL
VRGYFGIAVYHPKTVANVGTLWRSADLLEADFLCTIGKRYKRQASDTMKSTRHLPLFEYEAFDDFYSHMPTDCLLVGVELTDDAVLLEEFKHPQRAIYLLGAEDDGIPPALLKRCHRKVKLRGRRSMNLAVAGSIVAYDRTRA